MFAISYAAALLSVILAVSAVALLLSRTNTALARALALYCLTAAAWIGGNAAADVSYTVDALVLTSNIAFLGGALNLLLFLILVDLVIDRRMPSTTRLLLYAVPSLGLSAFAFSKYAIVDTYFPLGAPAQIIPGPLYLVTLFILVGALIYGVIRLVRGLTRESEDARRIQLSYVLLGLLLSLAGEIIFDVILPLLGEYRFYTLGPITSLFFVVGCTYALSQRRHFDIRLGLQRGVVYSILLASIVGSYVGILSVLLMLIPSQSVTAIYVSAGVVLVLGLFGARFIETYFKRLTDPIFFRDTYDYAEALHGLSEILYRNLELPELISESERALARVLRAQWVGINYAGEAGIDDLDLDAYADGRVIGVPITHQKTYIGTIHAGPKRGNDSYTAQDQRLLQTFALHAATAFSRAELHQKTKEHARVLEETVERRTRELRMAHDNEQRMLVELSHNLQTPLAIFQARLDQLKRDRLAEAEARPLEHALTRLSGFIYDLLTVAKLEREELHTAAHVDISAMLRDILEEVSVIAAAQNMSLEHEIAADLIVAADERRLREAILNVVSNALKYLDHGRERRVAIALTADHGTARLTISDTGVGISDADLPHVFDRFYRSERADLPGGTGLGLAITKRIIEGHRGRIGIESTEGVGTQVTITLPLIQS